MLPVSSAVRRNDLQCLSMPADHTTAEVLRAALDGDEEAWQTLVDDHRSVVWAMVTGTGLRGADAEDAFQLTFIRLHERGRSIHDPERLRSWLATTARNMAIDVHRRQRRTVPVDDFTQVADPSDKPPERGVLADEAATSVHRALEDVSQKCRELLRLLFSDPTPSYELVSETLDIPIGSIGPTRQRCLDSLRRSRHLRGAL